MSVFENVGQSQSEQPGQSNGDVRNSPQPPDPFDLQALRVEQDFGAALGVEKRLITLPVRKPSKETFVRTHPNDEYWLPTAVVELKDDREIFLIAPSLRSELATEATFGIRLLVVSMTMQGVPFIWPLRMPRSDGRTDHWCDSAMEAARTARENWVRVTANMGLGAFDVAVAESDRQPAWPKLPMADLLRIAFKNTLIDSLQHPVLKRLRGES